MKLGMYLSSCPITSYKTGLGPEPLKVLEENIGIMLCVQKDFMIVSTFG